MVPAQKHFLIFDIVDDEIVVILAALHQRQHVEKHVAELAPDARRAIAEIKRKP